MISDGNDFSYFKLTTLANFVQFKRRARPMLMFCLEDWGAWAPCPLATLLFVWKWPVSVHLWHYFK